MWCRSELACGMRSVEPREQNQNRSQNSDRTSRKCSALWRWVVKQGFIDRWYCDTSKLNIRVFTPVTRCRETALRSRRSVACCCWCVVSLKCVNGKERQLIFPLRLCFWSETASSRASSVVLMSPLPAASNPLYRQVPGHSYKYSLRVLATGLCFQCLYVIVQTYFLWGCHLNEKHQAWKQANVRLIAQYVQCQGGYVVWEVFCKQVYFLSMLWI